MAHFPFEAGGYWHSDDVTAMHISSLCKRQSYEINTVSDRLMLSDVLCPMPSNDIGLKYYWTGMGSPFHGYSQDLEFEQCSILDNRLV